MEMMSSWSLSVLIHSLGLLSREKVRTFNPFVMTSKRKCKNIDSFVRTSKRKGKNIDSFVRTSKI